MPDPVKLHRCSYTFLHTELDACWKVEKALTEQGIPDEVYRAESDEMAARVRSGELG